METCMLLNLNHIGQIALPVTHTDRSEAFYEKVLGLRKLYRYGDLSFFDCAGVRLLLEKVENPANFKPQGCIYFRCADIALAVAELERRGLAFTHRPHLIAKMDDHDLWMAFFAEPDGHTLAVMQEAPKRYAPAWPSVALSCPGSIRRAGRSCGDRNTSQARSPRRCRR
jgi:catechol 2,3-dioxygenase-like lactoylglutathione lyase family enzyme